MIISVNYIGPERYSAGLCEMGNEPYKRQVSFLFFPPSYNERRTSSVANRKFCPK